MVVIFNLSQSPIIGIVDEGAEKPEKLVKVKDGIIFIMDIECKSRNIDTEHEKIPD